MAMNIMDGWTDLFEDAQEMESHNPPPKRSAVGEEKPENQRQIKNCWSEVIDTPDKTAPYFRENKHSTEKRGGDERGNQSDRTVMQICEQELTEGIRNASIHCFGGVVFQCKNQRGRNLIAFAVSDQPERNHKMRDQRYYETDEMQLDAGLRFPRYEGAVHTGGYWVYLFKLPEGVRPVKELAQDCSDAVLSGLVELLIKYQRCYTENEYQPLKSICAHTVFVDDERNVYLVPLAWDNADLPVTVPRDRIQSVKTDIYSICYLVTEIENNGHKNVVDNYARPGRAIVERGLLAFPSWRPDLRTLASELAQSYAPPKDSAHATRPLASGGARKVSRDTKRSDSKQPGKASTPSRLKKVVDMICDLIQPIEEDDAQTASTWHKEDI